MSPVPIQRLDAWRGMLAKFGLAQGAPSVPVLLDGLQPAFDVRTDIRKSGGAGANLDLSAAAGTYVTDAAFAVPTGKRWFITRVVRGASLAATEVRHSVANRRMSEASLSSSSHNFDRWVLEAGESIGMATSGNVGDTGIPLTFYYEEEDHIHPGRA